uniref:Ig-like domain-containing protein n=1 Tax=Timema cristinae TaxID=61476 RepID=A0A7R9GY09_TIMCR|nr:unnamed protein product [Timema cristinae]
MPLPIIAVVTQCFGPSRDLLTLVSLPTSAHNFPLVFVPCLLPCRADPNFLPLAVFLKHVTYSAFLSNIDSSHSLEHVTYSAFLSNIDSSHSLEHVTYSAFLSNIDSSHSLEHVTYSAFLSNIDSSHSLEHVTYSALLSNIDSSHSLEHVTYSTFLSNIDSSLNMEHVTYNSFLSNIDSSLSLEHVTYNTFLSNIDSSPNMEHVTYNTEEGFLQFNVIVVAEAVSLRLVEVRIPVHAVRGQDPRLECHFDLQGEALYSVKWYKDGNEFYRFVPRDMPPAQLFPLPGVAVDIHNSTESQVVLKSVNLSSTGKYRCEVSAEAPSFQTVSDHGEMTVVASTSYRGQGLDLLLFSSKREEIKLTSLCERMRGGAPRVIEVSSFNGADRSGIVCNALHSGAGVIVEVTNALAAARSLHLALSPFSTGNGLRESLEFLSGGELNVNIPNWCFDTVVRLRAE